MQNIFMTVLDMSIAAGYCAVFVMLARLFIRKLPKGYSYVLWALVFVRLLLPVMPESAWSLLPKTEIGRVSQRIEAWMDEEEAAKGQAGANQDSINQTGTNAGGVGQPGMAGLYIGQHVGAGANGNTALVEIGLGDGNGASENENEFVGITENTEPENGWLTLLSRVWLIGSVLLVGYGVVVNVLLEKRLKGAKKMEDGVYEIENLPTAFVTGLLKPRIYLPSGLSEEYRRYVLEHERTHLKRGDVWVKYIAYMLISIHWFNPLAWISYVLMCRDMEMSCDERVLQNLGIEEKKAYSTALLAVASGRKIQLGIPVAFGEQGAKGRIVNVLHYRKPAFWVTAAAGVVLVVLAVGLLSDPRNEQMEEDVATESEVTDESASDVETESAATTDSESEIVVGSENEVATEDEAWEYKIITPQYVAEVEQWITVRAKPRDMSFSRWFDEYGGGSLQNLVNYDGEKLLRLPEGVVFYQILEKEEIANSVRKMLDTSKELSIMEWENDYQGRLWLVEYEDDVYVLMRFQNTYRLQKYEDMQTYKEKEVELEYVPIYAQDLNDKEILTEKLSYGANIVFLFRDYEHVNEMDPVKDRQLVFDNIGDYWEENIIDYYFDEDKYYEVMARKMGQDVSEFLAGHNLNRLPYGKVYGGRTADSMYMKIEVKDVKWLDDSQAEIYYSGTYYDGVAVLREHEGEMIFVAHHRIYEEETVTETETSENIKEHELLWSEENWQTFMEQNPSLKGIEDWLEDAASPIAYGGVASWFEEYNDEQFKIMYKGTTARSAGVVFYLEDGEALEEIMAKLLESLYLSKIVHVPGTLDGEVSYSRYLEEKAHHVGEVWLIEYLDDYYVMMEWQGAYRLQRLEAIMEYKEKEIQFEYVPLHQEDFSNTKILSEKLSKAVNLLLLYRDYGEASAFNPKENYEDMFEFVERGWGEEGIINYYLDETKYYEAMAQKTGQSMAEMLASHNIELTSYNKLYRAVRGDAIYAQAKVGEIKWLNDSQVEVHYAFGWFEDGHNVHYFDGVSVWGAYDGEMIFVSNRRLYD